MAFVERFSVDISKSSAEDAVLLEEGKSEIVDYLAPARIHIFCHVMDVGTQLTFSGDISDIELFRYGEDSQDAEQIIDFENGFAFHDDRTVLIASRISNKGIVLNYNSTKQNRVLKKFHRDVEK